MDGNGPIAMQFKIPFISEIVGSLDGRIQPLYAQAATMAEVPEIDLRDAPEAVYMGSTALARWHNGGHWVAMDQLPTKDLVKLGILEAIHANEPRKIAQLKHAQPLNTVRRQLTDIQSDTTDEFAHSVRQWAARNMATSAQGVFIRCPEPHYVVGRNMRRNGEGSWPRINVAGTTGFVRQMDFTIEHLVSAAEPDVAIAIYNRILDDGTHHHCGDREVPPEIVVVIPESISHPWHVESAAIAIDFLVEAGRARLGQMSVEDVRDWISVARMRDAGIATEDASVAAIQIVDRLQLQLGTLAGVVREVRDRFNMSIYGVKPHMTVANRRRMP
jgi:hypothetical protein